MSLILSLETSTKVCSVALHSEGKLLSSMEVLVEKSHSKIITLLCEQILHYTGFNYQQLSAIAVSKGPGSYTGLRIGVSTAKGLCYALDKPLIAINTLEAMAFEVNRFNTEGFLLCPMIDARRMEVYYALLDQQLRYIHETAALVLDSESFLSVLDESKVCFFGDGAFKMKSIIKEISNAVVLDNIHPSAKGIGSLATESFNKQKFEDLAYFEPYYLKDFVSK